MKKLAHFEAYIDFLSVVLVGAPDAFPRSDFLPESEQMNLDRAFEALRGHFAIVEARIKDPTALAEFNELLTVALTSYRAGDEMLGARSLQAAEKLLLSARSAA